MNTTTKMLIFCAAWAILVMLLANALRHDPGSRSSDFLLDMGHSPAPAAQTEALAGFDAPEGSVPRGFLPFPYGTSEEEGRRAGAEVRNPFESNSAVLSRGQRVYTAWCAACHGPTGLGDGEVTRRGVPPPPPLKSPEARARRDGEIYHIITLGRKNMSAHAAQVTREDRWKVIHYVRTLQGGQ